MPEQDEMQERQTNKMATKKGYLRRKQEGKFSVEAARSSQGLQLTQHVKYRSQVEHQPMGTKKERAERHKRIR
jgi:hypothetical protein